MPSAHGNASDWVGGEMHGGHIHVHGNAGHLIGSAYRGSAIGMTGGVILIDGSAGNEVGLTLRRGLVAIGGACGDFVGANMTFAVSRQQRRLDEVQLASQGFANANSLIYGAGVTVVLLMLPPVRNWLVDLVNVQSTGSPDISDRRAVQLAYTYGASLVVAIQTVIGLVAAGIWWRRMGGMRERPTPKHTST